MSVDTHAYIDGNVTLWYILQYLRRTYGDAETENLVDRPGDFFANLEDERIVFDNSDREFTSYGSIRFTCDDGERQLFYSYSNNKFREDAENELNWHPEELVMSETTFLSLGCWGSSVDIMKGILEYFGGGWLDENDCDDIGPYRVEGVA